MSENFYKLKEACSNQLVIVSFSLDVQAHAEIEAIAKELGMGKLDLYRSILSSFPADFRKSKKASIEARNKTFQKSPMTDTEETGIPSI